MASSRKKSCLQCRRSKARCSLETPCWRCAERSLDCAYEEPPPSRIAHRRRPLRPMNWSRLRAGEGSGPDFESSARGTSSLTDEQAGTWPSPPVADGSPNGDCAGPVVQGADLQGGQLQPTLHGFLSEPEPASLSWNVLPAGLTPKAPFDSGFASDDVADPVLTDMGLIVPLDAPVPPGSPCDLAPPPPNLLVAQTWTPYQGTREPEACAMLADAADKGTAFPRDAWRLYRHSPLAFRKNSTSEKCLTSKVIHGQLMAYPSMIGHGLRLPPFMFPPCALDADHSSRESCSEKGFHQCLPRALAICCSLVQSLQARTPGSVDYVWGAIYAEQERLRLEHSTYTPQETLEALQAAVIYLLLQAGDMASIKDHDIVSLLLTPPALGKKLSRIAEYESNRREPNRREWVFRESCRRTICLLFGIELLLDVNMTPMPEADCGGFAHVPLPSTRHLWEAVSHREWEARFRRIDEETARHKLLSIRDLRLSRSKMVSDGSAQDEQRVAMANLAQWCQGLDEFGMLVWMAAMLE